MRSPAPAGAVVILGGNGRSAYPFTDPHDRRRDLSSPWLTTSTCTTTPSASAVMGPAANEVRAYVGGCGSGQACRRTTGLAAARPGPGRPGRGNPARVRRKSPRGGSARELVGIHHDDRRALAPMNERSPKGRFLGLARDCLLGRDHDRRRRASRRHHAAQTPHRSPSSR